MTQSAVIGQGTAAAAVDMCDQPGCPERAAVSYHWDWGQSGTCCAAHQAAMNQTAKSLKRGVQFGQLASTPVAPLTRDERVKLKSEVYALEEENADVMRRNVALLEQNTQLAGQLQALTVRHRETEAQKQDAVREAQAAIAARNEAERKLGEHMDELMRLRLITEAAGESAATTRPDPPPRPARPAWMGPSIDDQPPNPPQKPPATTVVDGDKPKGE